MIIRNASKYVSTPMAKLKVSELVSDNINLYQIKCEKLILDFEDIKYKGFNYIKIRIIECEFKYITIINVDKGVLTRYNKPIEIIRSNIGRIYSKYKNPFCKGEECVKLIDIACGRDFNHNNADIVNVYMQSISL